MPSVDVTHPGSLTADMRDRIHSLFRICPWVESTHRSSVEAPAQIIDLGLVGGPLEVGDSSEQLDTLLTQEGALVRDLDSGLPQAVSEGLDRLVLAARGEKISDHRSFQIAWMALQIDHLNLRH